MEIVNVKFNGSWKIAYKITENNNDFYLFSDSFTRYNETEFEEIQSL